MSERILVDGFSRRVDYLRMSVTDRCDFRCVYCMAEDMQFLPRPASADPGRDLSGGPQLRRLGTRKIRLTGANR
jgi:cyclic pyranopterin phosphate synthase